MLKSYDLRDGAFVVRHSTLGVVDGSMHPAWAVLFV